MGTLHRAFWESSGEGLRRADRRSGAYEWYSPDCLVGRPLTLDAELEVLLADAEAAVRRLERQDAHGDLVGIARFLIRSEAIASSKIEGIAPAVRSVAIAELAQQEDIDGVTAQAKRVADNMTAVRTATDRLGDGRRVTVDDIVDLHGALLADEPHHHGIRTEQNWIGGSDWHPLDAEFVPPHPERVPELLDDLVAYLNGAGHAPIVQAGLVHAQFETIHPFTDGNGRVGRALIHTVLTRRGLTGAAVLPVSLVLATFSDRYVEGLTDFRVGIDDGAGERDAGANRWLRTFATSVIEAVAEADRLRAELESLRDEWAEQLDAARLEAGRKRGPRSDSTTMRLLENLPATPVLTTRTVESMYGVSEPAAARALDELATARILQVRSAGAGRRRLHIARAVLDLVTVSERRLASTRFDTRVSEPVRNVPRLPERERPRSG